MLYDHKRWDKPAVLSMDGLVAWLEKMPANGRYNYNDDRGGCLCGQYMSSNRIAWNECGEEDRLVFCRRVFIDVAHALPWTFGAALDRARKAAA